MEVPEGMGQRGGHEDRERRQYWTLVWLQKRRKRGMYLNEDRVWVKDAFFSSLKLREATGFFLFFKKSDICCSQGCSCLIVSWLLMLLWDILVLSPSPKPFLSGGHLASSWFPLTGSLLSSHLLSLPSALNFTKVVLTPESTIISSPILFVGFMAVENHSFYCPLSGFLMCSLCLV